MFPNLLRSLLAILIICLALFTAPLSCARATVSSGAGAEQGSSAALQEPQNARARGFHSALARVQPLLERYGYAAAAVATLVEGVGIPTPGQTLLIAGALEAAERRMNIALLLFAVAAGAIAGNSIGYAIGRWGGRLVLNKLRVDPQRQQHLDDLFKRRGGFVVLFGRFVDGIRQLNGILAGTLKMPWWKFTAYNVAGAVLWTGSWGLATYYFGKRIHSVAGFFHHHRPLLIALSAAALLALLIYLVRSRAGNRAR
jgi:membrane protein DedA with SNARE-associated domain